MNHISARFFLTSLHGSPYHGFTSCERGSFISSNPSCKASMVQHQCLIHQRIVILSAENSAEKGIKLSLIQKNDSV